MKDTDIDNAVENLFGPYTLKTEKVVEEKIADIDIPATPEKANNPVKEDKASPPRKDEFIKIKQLTGSMLKQLNQAIKSVKYGEKLCIPLDKKEITAFSSMHYFDEI